LHLIYENDEGRIDFLQKYFGYCATGDVREDLLLIALGRGGNGKTLIFGTGVGIFGTYGHVMAAEALMKVYGVRHPEELVRLIGVRLAIASEIQDGAEWNDQRLKILTGRDLIPARDMYGKGFFFNPSHKL
jgi:putative DNA primase/helicase